MVLRVRARHGRGRSRKARQTAVPATRTSARRALSAAQHVHRVRSERPEALARTVDPRDDDRVDALDLAEAEVHARVVAREVAEGGAHVAAQVLLGELEV